jgi:2,4-dienoyl-CoA reductase-like NADH-dependent reductase (Old Yellow Enzyme family)
MTASSDGVFKPTMKNHLDFTPLFQPITIRNLTLKNRFVMPGMQRGWCEAGHPPTRLAEYYASRAKGGVQLVLSESTAVDHPSATRTWKYGRLANDTVGGWARCAEAVHKAGGHFFMQLWHEGALRAEGGDDDYARFPTLSPSGLMGPNSPAGQAATAADLESMRDAFVRSARLAKQAGADGLEVHACHGYLLDQFLWSDINLRDDGYGGSDIAARVRFPAEIVRAIRDEVGPGFVISFRFSQWKLTSYTARIAQTPDELGFMLSTLRDAGVDMFHASTRRFWIPEWPGSDLGLAGWTKRLSRVPVIAVGSVGLNVDLTETMAGVEASAGAEQAPVGANLAELLRRFNAGEFDMVAVGRSNIADADWVAKLRDGHLSAIRTFSIADLGDVAAEASAAGGRAAGGTASELGGANENR